jgi:hypothetical protein
MGFGQTTNNKGSEGNKGPVYKIKVGGITVDVWENKGEHSTFNTFSMQRSYKKDDKWENTTSLREGDLPKAILALQKAYEKSIISEQDD